MVITNACVGLPVLLEKAPCMAEDIYIGDFCYSIRRWYDKPQKSDLRLRNPDKIHDVISRFQGDGAAMATVRAIVDDNRPGSRGYLRTDSEILELFSDLLLQGNVVLQESRRPAFDFAFDIPVKEAASKASLWEDVAAANADLAAANAVAPSPEEPLAPSTPPESSSEDEERVEDITPEIEDVRVEVLETIDNIDLAIGGIGSVQVEMNGIGGSIGEISTITGDVTAKLQAATSDASGAGADSASSISGASSGVGDCLSQTAGAGADTNSALSGVASLGPELSGLMGGVAADVADSVGQAGNVMGG